MLGKIEGRRRRGRQRMRWLDGFVRSWVPKDRHPVGAAEGCRPQVRELGLRGAAVQPVHPCGRPWQWRGRAGGSGIPGGRAHAWRSGPQPAAPSLTWGLHTLEAGWLMHVPGGFRCEECVTFMSLASDGLQSFQLLQYGLAPCLCVRGQL